MKNRLQRHAKIIEFIQSNKAINISDICKDLGVSSMTIRRDLNDLEREGLLLRTHGGAILSNKELEPPFVKRSFTKKEEKIQIGMTAARMVENGDVIAIDTGSTPLEVARSLDENIDIMVLTNFLPAALTLSKKRNIKVFLWGGILRKEELSLIGDSVIEEIRNFKIDKYFMGISGVSEERELMDFDPAEVAVKKAIMKVASYIVLVADHSKFFRPAPTLVAPLSTVHEIVTDPEIRPDQLKILEDEGIKITLSNRAIRRNAFDKHSTSS
ncbi:MAG: DeoR/GlpR family DNA-binding transcription regulator [Thermodesulfobacteriota bacterium]